MIKEYNFPAIFQNVVGQVIPTHILQKREQLTPDNPPSSHALSVATSSNPHSQTSNRKVLRIKSKKKELQRRSKVLKTMNCYSSQSHNDAQQPNSNNNNSKFLNFLKKKIAVSEAGTKNNKNSNIDEAEAEKQMSSLQSYQAENDAHLRKNHFKVRTSLDRASIDERVYMFEQGQNQLSSEKDSCPDNNYNYRKRQPKQEDYVMEEADQCKQDHFSKDNKENHFTRKLVRAPTKKTTRFFDRPANPHKKKTVNFTVQDNQNVQDNNNQDHIKLGARNFKKASEQSAVNSNRSRYTKNNTKNSQQSYRSNESQWTNKSVVSIKFQENGDGAPRSRSSLRSNQSILKGENMWIKTTTRKKTGTSRYILESKEALAEKKYKSDHDINSSVILDFEAAASPTNKIPSIKVASSIKSVKPSSKKHIKDSSKLIKRALKSKISLIRSMDNGAYTDVCDNTAMASIKEPNFSDTAFKRSTKNILKTMRIYTQERDVYEELNNFHRFLNENENIESQTQLVRTIAKPMVIPNETNIRVRRVNNQNMRTESLMFEMGLQLVRKMNRLAQKKL